MAAFIASLMFVVLAEMGDKTQLATVSLAVEYPNMLHVLMGTTLGMVIADAVGIIVGVVLRKHIPEKKIKWFSADIFALFGFCGLTAYGLRKILRNNQGLKWRKVLATRQL